MQKVKPHLTPREKAVLELTMDGLTLEEIGRKLGIRKRTARYFSDRLRKKLEVNQRHQLVLAGRRYFND